MMRDPESTIGNIVDHARIVYLSSIGAGGYPDTRAMLAVRERDGIRAFYLTTNTSSEKIRQFAADPKACLYVCDARFFRGVTLFGTVEMLQDEESRKRIWREGDERYYPQGVNDPDYTVLRFRAERGKYYHEFQVEEFEIK